MPIHRARNRRANERFLRNLEAFLICAHHHGIAVNFTFFAFSPALAALAQKNPYST